MVYKLNNFQKYMYNIKFASSPPKKANNNKNNFIIAVVDNNKKKLISLHFYNLLVQRGVILFVQACKMTTIDQKPFLS